MDAIKFFLKTKGKFKEGVEINHTGEVKVNHTTDMLSKIAANPELLKKLNENLDILDTKILDAEVVEELPEGD